MIKYGCSVSQEERIRLAKHFRFLELRDTFFQRIQAKTLSSWKKRNENNTRDGQALEYAIVASMSITHPLSDPLQSRCQYKRNAAEDGGHFKLNDDSRRAMEHMLLAAEHLAAPWIVFRTPTSFRPTQQNRDLFAAFFDDIDPPRHTQFVWHPGGLWTPELAHALSHRSNVHCALPDWTQIPLEKSLYLHINSIAFPEKELIEYLPKIPSETTTHIAFSGKNKVRQARKLGLILDLLNDG